MAELVQVVQDATLAIASKSLHGLQTDAVPVVSSQKPSTHAETSLSEALVQVYVAPMAAFSTVEQAATTPDLT